MQVIVWIAAAVILGPSGDVTVVAKDEAFKTQAECLALQSTVRGVIADKTDAIAFGLVCTPVKVNEIKRPASLPVEKSGTRKQDT